MNEPTERSIASLRRLARGLVYDGASAEDVVQEAWLSALKRREALERPQGWLANAVRWCALRARRADERRGRHERAAARSEEAPEAGELSGRTEVLRRLLDAVDRLPEPYRTAVHLRYLEDLPPRKIAQRLGLPVNTARTHVRRGLELLRKELDDDGRGREELLAALAPIVGPDAGIGSAAGVERLVARARESMSVAGAPARLAAALALAGTVLFVGWRLIRQGEPREPSPAALAVTATTIEPGTEQDSSTPLRSPTTKASAREPATPETSAVSATWSVRGCVTRGGDEPFPHAQLVGRIHRGPGLEGAVLFSERFLADEFGEFVWAPPIAEHSTVYVTTDVPGHIANPSYDWIVPGDPGAFGWHVSALPLDLELTGVVRALDGSPIAGAVVVDGWLDDFRCATTDAGGNFMLSLWSGNSVDLRVRAAGFAVTEVEAGANPLEIRLAPESPRLVRIVDEEGAPVAGVEITRHGLDLVLHSDAQGRFALHELVAREANALLFLRHPDYSERQFYVQGKQLGDAPEVVLARGVTLTGRVVSSTGEPVPGAWISLDSHYSEPRHETWSGADGRFELPHAVTGEHALWVWRNGFAHLRTDIVVTGEANGELELVLQPPHFVAGTAFGPDGPLAFAHVSAVDLGSEEHIEGFRTRTDRDGNFRMEGLTEHGVRLRAFADGLASAELEVDSLDRENLELHLQPSAVFAGRAVDDASGAPIAEFTVRSLRLNPSGGPAEVPWNERGTNGTWSHATRLAAGSKARIEVRAPGYAPLVLGPIESRWPADPEASVARLSPGGVVRGRVLDAATGLGVSGAVVARYPARSMVYTNEDWLGTILTVRTDANGAFELVDVPLGEGKLHVQHDAYAPHLDGPFLVGPLATERLLEMTHGATLAGRLLDAEGNGLAGEKVDLAARFAAGKKWYWTTASASDGSYSFGALPNGQYELFWYRPDGERHYPALSTALTLAPGAELTLDLQPHGSTRLIGTLTCGFELAAPATVRLTLATTPEAPFPARSYGALATADHFQLDHLEPGTYSLSAWANLTDGRSASGQTTVVVPESGELVVTLPLVPR